MAEDVFRMTHTVILSIHNLARSWDGNACLIRSTCIIYMMQYEEKVCTSIIYSFNARLCLWNTQSDCNPEVALLHHLFLLLLVSVQRQGQYHNYQVKCWWQVICVLGDWGGGPRVVVSTAAFHARVRGSVPGLGGFKETKMFLPHPRVKVSIAGSLRDREVACSASDRQGSNFESCVWRTVSSQSSHHPQEVLLAQFSLYVHKGGLKPDSFHFISFLLGDWV